MTASAVGATPIAAGDRVLVIQMQDSVGALEGNYEYATVTSIAGATHNLAAPLVNSYAQSVGATQLQTFQVIRVPQYANLTVNGTISPPAWTIDASGRGTGGVIALDVSGVLTMGAAGVIDASGRGFRGAFGINGTGNRAGGTSLDANYTPVLTAINGSLKGEGVNGVPNQLFAGTATPVVYTQGLYAVGTAGQGANGNAAGGGNDGTPASGNNQYNGGGGGGGGYSAGGNGGINWDNGSPQTAAGGRGGNALASSSAKAYFGGGGGAGATNNNTGANTVTTYPPFVPTANINTVTQNNGASGAVSVSGAVGGGIVMVQANTISAAAGSSIQANGNRAYATNGGSEAAGGGGGGGTVLVFANSSTGTLAASATGGRGGDSNYYNHGPGGGGGGGYIGSSAGAALTPTVIGGANGLDATNGGGNVADAYGSTAGTNGLAQTLATPPSGTTAGAQCAPALTVTKLALTPAVTTTTAATAQYSIVVSNAATGGAARNVEIIDNALPPGWTLAAAPTYAYSPAGPAAANNFASGADTAADVAGYSINASPTAAPTVVPTVGSNSMTWSSLFIAPGGAATITFSVNIPDTARVGTYHNPAGVRFADFTSNTGKVSPLLQNTANRTATSYGATAYASGASVGGSNYSGLEAGPITDDVRLLPDLSVTKTGPAQLTAGAVFSYLLTPRNSGRTIGTQTFATTQATTVAQANVPAVLGSSPLRVTDTLPAAITTTGAPTGTNWTCSVAGSTVTCDYFQATPASAYPLAGQADLPVITIPSRLVQSACGANVTNTAVISAAAGETGLANNTSTLVISSNCQSTITISKISAGTSVAAGGTTSYTITVANLGPGSADGAVLADPAVAGLSCTAATCTGTGGAVCTSPTPAVALLQSGLTIPTLPAQSQVVVTLACSVTATGQ
ncbi:MAG: hypothetical protein Q7T87_13870 [Polaromonas sp.]|nr:hypothetical protein [Polaromonas sp.]